ncbi:hypothetical protein [Dactylosporangium sp. NPDC000521]|uniref:hypothetical protein n=1 Tax=Dactylosporangium sp. NPDC000521 TaxID=3363975 RepID=UPI0036B85FD1
MELRDALVRRTVTPEQRVAITEAILRIEELVDRGIDATAALAILNETTGHSFGFDDFRYHCGAPDREELIERACAPPQVRLPNVTRDDLVEIVRRILADPTDDWHIEAFEHKHRDARRERTHLPPLARAAGRDRRRDRRRRAGLPPDRPVTRYELKRVASLTVTRGWPVARHQRAATSYRIIVVRFPCERP